ncbi:putative transporter MCH4 [Cytospora mali]|uniref:Transporter MCH4 n=1 Tax=Cytospora mali TaxID=578113 RepID=A0A194USF6_CYTMA|nr:putative transporter MCH4 [Valsa mali var. pyri (nom. inval.)]
MATTLSNSDNPKMEANAPGYDSSDIEKKSPLHAAKEPAEEHDFPEGGSRAWMVAAGTAGVLFSTMGLSNAFGVFQAYYMTHQLKHKSSDDIAWIGSVQAFLLLASGAVGGPLFDRFGAKVICPAAILYVFAIMMTSICREYYQFMLAQGVLMGLSMGMLMFPSMAALPQYFHKKRGGAMGIAIAGSSLGGVIFPIALGKMLNSSSDLSFGWAVRIIGFIVLPVLTFSSVTIKARFPPRASKFFLPSAFKMTMYDLLIAAMFFLFIGMFVPLFFVPTYAITRGMSSTLSSYIVAIFNAGSIFGRILPGILADKFGRLNMLMLAGVTSGILVFVWDSVIGTAGIIVYSLILGFTSGAIISGSSVAVSICAKDPRNIGTLMGQGMALASISTLVGPPVSGALYDRFGGFFEISMFAGSFCMFGSLLLVLVKYFTAEGVFGRV